MKKILKRIYKYIKMKKQGIKVTFKSTENTTLNGSKYGKSVGYME